MKFSFDGTPRTALNTLFPLAVWYLRNRSESAQSVIWRRDFRPIIDAGLIDEDTLSFLARDIELIEEVIEMEQAKVWK